MLAAAGALAGAAGLPIQLIRPANAQRQANPAEFALRIQGVNGASDSSWDGFRDGAKGA